MSVPTPRGADVVRRAQKLGLTAEYNSDGETVTITGATRTIFTTVSHADAYLRGYFDGAGRAHRWEAEQRLGPRVRKCPGGCGRTILYGTCKECVAWEATP